MIELYVRVVVGRVLLGELEEEVEMQLEQQAVAAEELVESYVAVDGVVAVVVVVVVADVAEVEVVLNSQHFEPFQEVISIKQNLLTLRVLGELQQQVDQP